VNLKNSGDLSGKLRSRLHARLELMISVLNTKNKEYNKGADLLGNLSTCSWAELTDDIFSVMLFPQCAGVRQSMRGTRLAVLVDFRRTRHLGSGRNKGLSPLNIFRQRHGIAVKIRPGNRLFSPPGSPSKWPRHLHSN
jgi:hypothetical protein